MPTIGEEIKKLREARGLSQAELVARAGIDASMLSRLENGKIKTPSEETIRKLASALDYSATKLLSYLNIEKNGTSRTVLRVGFGHCIWAAPVITLVMQSRISGMMVTSYGFTRKQDEIIEHEPYWYDAELLRSSRIVKAGPSFVQCSEIKTIPKVVNWEFNDKNYTIKSYTADDLIDLLLADDLDCIIVPGELYSPYQSLLIRCAYIMNSARSGCSLLAIGREVGERYDSFQDLLQHMQNITNGPQVKTLFARGTIAQRQLDFYLSAYLSDLQQYYVDLGDWNGFWQQSRDILETEGGLFFIGWEPQLSWLRKAIRDWNKEYKFYEVELPEFIPRDELPDKREQYLTFDIMFRKSSKIFENYELSNIIQNFFAILNAAISEISHIRNSQAPAVRLIAKYLDMPSEQCYNTLSKLNFALRFYPEWVDYLHKY